MNEVSEKLYIVEGHMRKAATIGGNARLERIERALELLVQVKALCELEELNHSSKALSGG